MLFLNPRTATNSGKWKKPKSESKTALGNSADDTSYQVAIGRLWLNSQAPGFVRNRTHSCTN
jgi:hypothetical protein